MSAVAGRFLRRSGARFGLPRMPAERRRTWADRGAKGPHSRRGLARRAPSTMGGLALHRRDHRDANRQENRRHLNRNAALYLVAAARSGAHPPSLSVALEHRKQPALAARRHFPLGGMPNPQGSRGDQSGHDAPRNAQPALPRAVQNPHQAKTPQSGHQPRIPSRLNRALTIYDFALREEIDSRPFSAYKRFIAVGPFLERGEKIKGDRMSRSTENDKVEQLHHDQFRAEPVKRPYSRPVVVAHGNLREITLHVAQAGHLDGGGAPHSKTA